MIYPLYWPADSNAGYIAPTQILLFINNSSRGGGPSIAGNEQIVQAPTARWEGKMTFAPMDPTTLLNWRGFVSAMNGRYGTALVPIFEVGRQTQTGVTAAAAALNATVLTLTVPGGIVVPGNRFSIAGNLYEIQQSVFGSLSTSSANLFSANPFTFAGWGTTGASIITQPAGSAQDQINTAAKLAEDSSTGNHFTAYGGASVGSGQTVTFSIYVKAAERNAVQLNMYDGSAFATCNFDLAAGTAAPAGSITGYLISNIGNGWWRIWIRAVMSVTGSPGCYVSLLSRSGSTLVGNYTGISGHGLLIWAAQVEIGSVPTAAYIDTFAVNILPWLRVAIGASTPCEFVNPFCTMRFLTDGEGKLDLQRGRIARPEINLIEAF